VISNSIAVALSLAIASPRLQENPRPAASPDLARSLMVPMDHAVPERGCLSIDYELGAAFDAAKPTVLVLADAQQFFLRKGAVAGIQQSQFGAEFNVVGVIGRGSSHAFVEKALDASGKPDWVEAWRIFRAEQWIDDIDAVRKAIVGENGKILLYGASGGSWLAQQYLARHGSHAERAFLASPLNPFAVGDLGLKSDRFSEEIAAYDPKLPSELAAALRRYATDRERLVMTLQRQNFFVPPESIAAARADLIRALAAGDDQRYLAARKEYQVDEVSRLFESNDVIPIRVRLFESLYPSHEHERLGGAGFYPNIENQATFAAPLLALVKAAKIDAPTFESSANHRLGTEVFILAGRFDHTVDYRSAIATAASYPRHHLFIAADDHMFAKLAADGTYAKLVRTFLAGGFDSDSYRTALRGAEGFRWREN
jgi:pimeloyl-ACP methyl ester carboxylesterase